MSFDPLEIYSLAEAAAIMGVTEDFLIDLLVKAEQNKVIERQPERRLIGYNIAKLGKTYYRQIESEQHRLAFIRVRERDDELARERGL